ncbi:hypothetical protein B9G69_003715 [Bdellovibrio sp. SKB1291214]|uniref:hypothetical protein n=1 Tax=Bdellovibrio sp. SKB1291214 TaxID=1732569 RepID=UPI000B51CE52|nr:hypothetical protein [Bdellovibrio sp. SKB1291214]UYL09680.1 hypothetical protein B9G69_003715 [Bdellovibrio sp. SKB1291214]
MKNLIIAVLVVFNLSYAGADETDLPVPGDDGAGTVQPLPEPPQQQPENPTPQPVPPPPSSGGPGVDTDDQFTIGDRALGVTDGLFVVGTIANISRDGKIITIRNDFNGQFTSLKSKYVGVWLNCNSKGYCVGGQGMYQYNRGRNYNPIHIEGVYSNGYLLVQEELSTRRYVATLKEVLRATNCDRKTRICKDEMVLTEPVGGQPYFETRVVDVYEDGVYLINSLNGGKDIRKNGDLVKQVTCHRSLCVGQQVMFGTILRAYDNGFFTIQDPYSGNLTLRPYREIR